MSPRKIYPRDRPGLYLLLIIDRVFVGFRHRRIPSSVNLGYVTPLVFAEYME